MLVTLTVMAFTSNMIFANSSAKDLALKNSCISTNPELGDSAYWAVTAIEQFAEKKFSNAIETVDTCFHQWGPEAGQKQKVMNRKNKVCPPIGKVSSRKKRKIDKNYLMNDVSMALWAKARSQHELGQLDAFDNLDKNKSLVVVLANHAQHVAEGADTIDVRGAGIVEIGILLGDEPKQAPGWQELLEQLLAGGALNGKWGDGAGKQHNTTKWH